jgi:hypothetical protein
MRLRGTESSLRKDLEYALQLLNQMPRLSYLKLGVGVVEFLAYSAPESTSEMPNLASILDRVRQGRLNHNNHSLLRARDTVSCMVNLHKVRLELEWDDFLLNSYT